MLTGCKDESVWAQVEAERRRIANELVANKVVTPEQKDTMLIVVFDRPRTKADTQSTGYDHAVTRVNRERVALAEAKARLFADRRSLANPAGRGDVPDEIAAWEAGVKRARRLVLVGEAVQTSDDWLSVLDLVVGDQLKNSPSKIPPRTLPDTESLRLKRAQAFFTDWTQRFEEVDP